MTSMTETLVECSECGHLHFDTKTREYVECPLRSEGCTCPFVLGVEDDPGNERANPFLWKDPETNADVMVQRALEHPVPSARHEWEPGQQADYNRLKAKGRTLYDNLRTQFPGTWDHDAAWDRAMEEFGLKDEDTEPCCITAYQTRGAQHHVTCEQY